MGGLFGDREAVVFDIADDATRATLLGRLLRLAYVFIRPTEDEPPEDDDGTSTRGYAESARAFLLSCLIDTPGAQAHRVLLTLAQTPEFQPMADSLRYQARKRAAADAEFPPFDAQVLNELDTRFEVPPQDRDGLFQTMVDRLEDLAHEIDHHDFSNRRTLRTIQDEAEMQRTLALRLEAHAKGAYRITREDEVADCKRTDIRLHAVRGHQRAVIEVKLADTRWSLSDLEAALEAQLVGRYLRHETCKAGCLLLIYNGTKRYWMPAGTKAQLSFSQMIVHLQEKARMLEAQSGYQIRLTVFGLDFAESSGAAR